MEKAREVTLVRGLVGAAHQAGKLVGLVPTMGALHEGHMSLVRLARETCEFVVVSIFVNPLQFGPGEDFQRYPRRPEKDAALCEQAGVDLLYTPGARDFYPSDFSTAVEVADVSEGGEGAVRPGHFRGVATVLTKIFLQVSPDLVVFGRKDLLKVTVPTLVVHGDDDQIVPFEISGKKTAAAIKGSQLEVLKGAPHAFAATHSAELNTILLAFLKKA